MQKNAIFVKTNLMEMSVREFAGVLIGLFVSMAIQAQTSLECGYRSINEQDAREIVSLLASDSLQGRDAGTEGGRMAAEFVSHFLNDCNMIVIEQSFTTVKNGNNWVTEADMDISEFIAAGNESRTLKNIVALIPGIEKRAVVIGAHYDHLGIDTTLIGDQCFNGADDNASGVSAVLQIARAMKVSGKKPRRTVIFTLWDGEEKGVLGSRYFVKNFPYMQNLDAYMNFDMIGRGPEEKPLHMSYLYTSENPLFGEWLRADMENYGFSLEPFYKASENLLGGSDNIPFARAGIPIVWYHTEGHPDYHRPSDTADKIDYGKLTDITRVAYLCTWRLANELSY